MSSPKKEETPGAMIEEMLDLSGIEQGETERLQNENEKLKE